MGVTHSIEVLSKSVTPSGRGVFLSRSGLLYVGSQCCSARMIRVSVSSYDNWHCSVDHGDKVKNHYESTVNISMQLIHNGKKVPWQLENWLESWTGLVGAEINIDYM